MGWKKKVAQKLLRGPLLPYRIAAALVPERLLKIVWVLGVFTFVVLPSFLGTYGFLRYNDVPWYIAVASSIGIEIGGPLLSVLNNIQALGSAGGIDQVLILVGIVLPLIHFHMIYMVYTGFVKWWDPTISRFLVAVFGLGFLSLFIMITLLTDHYILTGEQLRLSGITYFLNSPQAALDPLLNVAGPHFNPDQAFNRSSALNTAVNNTSIGG